MQVYRLKGVLLAAEVAHRLTSAGHASSLYGAGAGSGAGGDPRSFERVTPVAVECTLAALTTRLTGKPPACMLLAP